MMIPSHQKWLLHNKLLLSGMYPYIISNIRKIIESITANQPGGQRWQPNKYINITNHPVQAQKNICFPQGPDAKMWTSATQSAKSLHACLTIMFHARNDHNLDHNLSVFRSEDPIAPLVA